MDQNCLTETESTFRKNEKPDICHETEIKPLRRQLCDSNNTQEKDEIRDLKVFIHPRCEGDCGEVRELRHYGRDLMIVEREMSCTACSLGQWIA
jgi:hypothetical protein